MPIIRMFRRQPKGTRETSDVLAATLRKELAEAVTRLNSFAKDLKEELAELEASDSDHREQRYGE